MKRLRGFMMACAVVGLALPGDGWASCGQAFCTVEGNSPAARPLAPWQLRLGGDMEYIEQKQAWVGYHPVSVGDVARPDHQEIETTNLTWKLRADLAVDEHWSFGLVLPVVHREHLHLAIDQVASALPGAFQRHSTTGAGEVTIGNATGTPERWNFTDIGDMEATVRYSLAGEGFLQGWSFSAFAGLKLPSGRTNVRSDGGEEAEITLQPGTGAVDPLAGVFAQRVFQAHDLRGEESHIPLFTAVSLHAPGSDGRFGYRPGLESVVALGSVLPLTKRVELLGQINFRYKDRDHVGDAPGVPREHTGGETLHLSPGARLWLSETTGVFSYVQVPVLRRVNGIQLVSDWNLLFGVTHEFNL